MLGRKEKSNMIKTNNTTWGNKSEGTGEKRKTKKIPKQEQTTQTKQDILKQCEKIIPESRERMHENIWTTGWQGNKILLEQDKGTKRT